MHSNINPSPAMMVSGCDLQKEVGDIVQLGGNEGPEYRVIAIDGDDAWIRSSEPKRYGSGSHIVALGRLRWIRAGQQEQAA